MTLISRTATKHGVVLDTGRVRPRPLKAMPPFSPHSVAPGCVVQTAMRPRVAARRVLGASQPQLRWRAKWRAANGGGATRRPTDVHRVDARPPRCLRSTPSKLRSSSPTVMSDGVVPQRRKMTFRRVQLVVRRPAIAERAKHRRRCLRSQSLRCARQHSDQCKGKWRAFRVRPPSAQPHCLGANLREGGLRLQHRLSLPSSRTLHVRACCRHPCTHTVRQTLSCSSCAQEAGQQLHVPPWGPCSVLCCSRCKVRSSNAGQ